MSTTTLSSASPLPRPRVRSHVYPVALLLAGGIILRIFFLFTNFADVSVNGDEGVNFLMGQYIAQGNFPLLFWGQPYQFPFEAYLMAPFAPLLSWNGWGVRIVPVTLCLLGGIILAAVYRFLAPLRTTWPGLILILFPSTYWLIRQVGLLTPQHSAMVLFIAVLLYATGAAQKGTRPGIWVAIGGVFAGMALSNHLLSLSVVAPCAAALCLSTSLRGAVRSTLSFLPSFLLGFSPYLVAKLTIPGAYHTVSERLPLSEAFSRIFSPVLTELVPTALGVNPFVYPDGGMKISLAAFLVQPVALLFLVVLVLATLIRMKEFLSRLSQSRWPSVTLNDVFVGASWLSILLMAMTKMELRPRYALHAVWCFPFLLSYLYGVTSNLQTRTKQTRHIFAIAAVFLMTMNIAVSVETLQVWTTPGFSKTRASMPPLRPLKRYFTKHGISHCYAGWWLSYQLIVSSKEKIVCMPAFNDRFRGWPLPPYQRAVHLDPNTPYVAGVYDHRFLRGKALDRNVLKHGFLFDKKQVGAFQVYTHFRHPQANALRVLPSSSLTASPSGGARPEPALTDGDLRSYWESATPQQSGMKLHLSLKQKRRVYALRIFSPDKILEDSIPKVDILAQQSDSTGWVPLVQDLPGTPHLLKLDKTLPRYVFDGMELLFGLPPTEAEALRITISTPKSDQPWRISEVQLFSTPE